MREPHPRIVLGLHRSRYERGPLEAALDLGITAIDTAFNYHGFTAHTTLTRLGSLLSKVTVSTKVGYFPGPVHSLDAVRLRRALEQTNRDLGRAPELVFLHNPEQTLSQLAPAQGRDRLAQACTVLSEASSHGLCAAWGIASWRPGWLVSAIDDGMPEPHVLMIRSGLLVSIDSLDAADSLAVRWNLPRDAVWGMSPFGGNAKDPVWDRFEPRAFLRDPAEACSPVQAAFRVAYRLPPVGAVAVGSDNPAHLHELVESLSYEVDDDTVLRYRHLLRDLRRV